MLILMFREYLWFRIIVIINCDTNATMAIYYYIGFIIFLTEEKEIYLLCRSRQFDFMSQFHESIARHPSHTTELLKDQNKLLSTLLHHMNVTTRGKQLNIREVSMEEIINGYFNSLPPQAPVVPRNKNQTLKLVPLWEILVSLADGPAGAGLTSHAKYRDTKAGSNM